jgi:hypothetical protein
MATQNENNIVSKNLRLYATYKMLKFTAIDINVTTIIVRSNKPLFVVDIAIQILLSNSNSQIVGNINRE